MSGPEVLVVGAGPTGLSAARDLARLGHSVVIVEREAEAGGIPRHSITRALVCATCIA